MKFAVLVFCMNSLEVTSMVFRDIDTGLRKVEELTGRKMEHFLESDGKEGYTLDIYDEFNSDPDEKYVDLPTKFFKFYSPGCGEAGWMELREVEEGTPFCGWDLD
jgi:hypothetical protein